MPMEHDSPTGLLRASRRGDVRATELFSTAMLSQLRRVAAAHLRKERAGHTLQPTAVVNEVYLMMVGQEPLDPSDRTHFMALAARMVRRVLVNHARSRGRHKRGGRHARVPLAEDVQGGAGPAPELLDLDEALQELQRVDPRAAQVVELHVFGGMSHAEVAATLGDIGASRVGQIWRLTRRWLEARLDGRAEP